MALENLDENQAARRGENQDSNFDSLKDLKALKEKKSDENGENNDTDNAGDANETLEKVLEARKGNIYAAVVLAKGLERNESNPLASGRFSRFMNSIFFIALIFFFLKNIFIWGSILLCNLGWPWTYYV